MHEKRKSLRKMAGKTKIQKNSVILLLIFVVDRKFIIKEETAMALKILKEYVSV